MKAELTASSTNSLLSGRSESSLELEVVDSVSDGLTEGSSVRKERRDLKVSMVMLVILTSRARRFVPSAMQAFVLVPSFPTSFARRVCHHPTRTRLSIDDDEYEKSD